MNEELAAEGKAAAAHVEHRSFKDRGAGQKATKHQDVARTNGDRAKKRRARAAWQRAAQTGSYGLNRKITNSALVVDGLGEVSLLPSVWRRVLGARRNIFHTFRNLSLFEWSAIIYDQFDLQAIAARNAAESNYTISDMEDSNDAEIARFGRIRGDLTMGYGLNLENVMATLLQHYGLYSPVLDLSTDIEIGYSLLRINSQEIPTAALRRE
jgi:hypothetical protein